MSIDIRNTAPSASGVTVAVLGTGTMGAAMARNLLAAGHAVRVWNRHAKRAAPLAGDGATVCQTTAEAAAGASHLLTTLWDFESVSLAAREAVPALPAGALWLQASTVGLEGSQALASLAEMHGVDFIDSPVLGTKGPAEQGTLVVLASGDPACRPRADVVFDAVGARTIWVDRKLGASKLKLVVNAWVLAQIEGIAESVQLAERTGIDPELFLDAIAGTPTDSLYAQSKGRVMITRDFRPSFRLAGALKDADLVLDAARTAGVEMVVTTAVRDQLRKVVADGHGDADMAAIFRAHSHR
jgi:3-hydroxyisobutyrate dehydrogenase